MSSLMFKLVQEKKEQQQQQTNKHLTQTIGVHSAFFLAAFLFSVLNPVMSVFLHQYAFHPTNALSLLTALLG